MIVNYKNKEINIDTEDLELLNSRNWYYINANKKGNFEKFYLSYLFKGKTIYLHREILKAKKGDMCNYKDGNTLNFSKENLRICERAEIYANRRQDRRSIERDLPPKVYCKKGSSLYFTQIQRRGFYTLWVGYFNSIFETKQAFTQYSDKVDSGEIKLRPKTKKSTKKRFTRTKFMSLDDIKLLLSDIDKSNWCEDRMSVYNYINTGDMKFLNSVFSKYYTQLLNECAYQVRRNKKQEDDAYDIIQDVFLLFIEEINNGKFSLLEWTDDKRVIYRLNGILNNEIRNYLIKTENTHFESLNNRFDI